MLRILTPKKIEALLEIATNKIAAGLAGFSRRRITDARLWDAMTPAQQSAGIAIADSHELIGRGLGYVASNWQRIPGYRSSSNVSEAHARMVST